MRTEANTGLLICQRMFWTLLNVATRLQKNTTSAKKLVRVNIVEQNDRQGSRLKSILSNHLKKKQKQQTNCTKEFIMFLAIKHPDSPKLAMQRLEKKQENVRQPNFF